MFAAALTVALPSAVPVVAGYYRVGLGVLTDVPTALSH
jgi:hypothetical protein